jgi:hypothetical protein
VRRTSILALVVAAVLGLGVGFAIDAGLTMAGRPTFTPAVTLPILLVALAGAVVLFALPVRRAIREGRAGTVDPFRAVRVAMLAKASSILGSGLTGAALGLLAFLATRPVPPPVGSLTSIIATAVSAAVLVAAALVAETMCIIRKDDDDEPPEPEPGATPSHH